VSGPKPEKIDLVAGPGDPRPGRAVARIALGLLARVPALSPVVPDYKPPRFWVTLSPATLRRSVFTQQLNREGHPVAVPVSKWPTRAA
jgi:hypothetical protein